MSAPPNLHGTCLAVGSHGVLLLGSPGSGKSDLALRLIDQPGFGTGDTLLKTTLVADDQVMLRREGERLIASAPSSLRGLLEVRGLGIVHTPVRDEIPVSLALRLVAGEKPERMPELEIDTIDLLGVSVPLLQVSPFHASAPAFVRAAAQTAEKLFFPDAKSQLANTLASQHDNAGGRHSGDGMKGHSGQ